MKIYFDFFVLLICIIEVCYSEVCANADDIPHCRKKTLAFEAIADLHNQLDGDNSGGVDYSEASNFLGEKLSYPVDQFSQKALSQEDGIISLLDLWVAWRKNPAHNWTVAETIKWLSDSVELPEYGQLFSDFKVDGESIPRLVSRSARFLNDELGIKNPFHRRKLSLKAMDLILFGPPKKNLSTVVAAGSLLAHLTRDMPLVPTLVVASAFILSLVALNHHYTLRLRSATSGNYDRLSRAEQTLQELHQELMGLKEVESMTNRPPPVNNRTVQIDGDALFHHSDCRHSSEQISLIPTKHSRTEPPTRKPSESSFFPRRTVTDATASALPWSTSPVLPAQATFYIGGSERLSGNSVAAAAKRQLDGPATELALLLQMTHELELRHYWEKRSAAAKQLMAAKEACDRVRRKRSSLVGSVRLIHSDNLDDVDAKLNAARRVLENVTADMQERKNRWSRIEDLTGFNLQQPTDLNTLMTALGYEKSRYRPGGEDNNSGLRLFDLSTDFSLFTGEDFVEEQPSISPQSNEGTYSRALPEWQNKSIVQNLAGRLRTEAPPAADSQYSHPDSKTEQSAANLMIQPNISSNYSFVRPFATLWRRKVKAHQQTGCFGPKQSIPQIRPHFTLDPGQSAVNYNGYHRKPSVS